MSTTDHTGEHTNFAGIQALTSRGAGYAVAQKCLEVQAAAEARDPSLRTDKRVVLHGDAWPWYTGALGEIEVGRMLSALGPEWFVRHAVPIGAGTKDVDHLVIGPGGVFAINTKHHSGARVWVGDYVLRVNNENTHHLKAARADGIDVSRRLATKVGFPVPVTSVIAVLNPHSVVDIRAPHNRPVSVVDARHLVGWLRSFPQQLSDTKLSLLKLAAEEPETWHVDPHAADTLRVMQRFERLVAQTGGHLLPPTPAVRTPAPARVKAPRTPKPSGVASRSRSKKGGPADLLKLWLVIAAIVTAVLVVRAVADQPCSSALTCIAPYLYLGLKPLLILLMCVSVLGGMIATLVWIVRRAARR